MNVERQTDLQDFYVEFYITIVVESDCRIAGNADGDQSR